MKKLTKLSETELEIMQAVWELAAPVTVAQLLERFQSRKGWKTSTLSTLLARLIDKGLLTKTMEGKSNSYTQTVTGEEYRKWETKTFMKTVHGGSVKSFIAALVEDDGMTLKEIEELKAWLADKSGGV